MKRSILLAFVVLFLSVQAFAQVSGNRIYGNRGYAKNNRAPVLNTGSIGRGADYAIEASVLLNVEADSFVAVFAVSRFGRTAELSNANTNRVIEGFKSKLTGVAENDVYVDFLTQNRVYNFEVEGDFAKEKLNGFETKKTVAIRYQDPKRFEEIVSMAASQGIFDLVKVDYVVKDFEKVRSKLFEEAVKVVKQKEERYRRSFDANIKSIGISVEKYDAFYPSDRYQDYTAFESGAVQTTYSARKTIIKTRKSSTFFYEPVNGSGFDKVVNEIGIKPKVQFTLLIRVDYKRI